MVVEVLARHAEVRRLTVQEARDGLIHWFVARAFAQVRKGMKYTAPGASHGEVERVAQLRARSFFLRLASPFDEPTWADLRRVKGRMQTWLLPRRGLATAIARETELWDFVLSGAGPARIWPPDRSAGGHCHPVRGGAIAPPCPPAPPASRS